MTEFSQNISEIQFIVYQLLKFVKNAEKGSSRVHEQENLKIIVHTL
jgi:hypothetical protein